jgi:hypothetical protein
MTTFKYDSLPLRKDEIRLLRIENPRILSSFRKIRCQLVRVSLDETPKFKALSYTWGTGTRDRTIVLNDSRLFVTESPETALNGSRYLAVL